MQELVESNRIVKSIGCFRKIGATRGILHARMGTRKDRKFKDLTKEDEIKKKWQECTEKLHKKGLHDLDNDDGVVTHPEPDILDCEVKWALGSITTNTASGGDRLAAELFQVLEDGAVKELHSL